MDSEFKNNQSANDLHISHLGSETGSGGDRSISRGHHLRQEITPISEREWRKLIGMHNTIEDFDPLQIVSHERQRKSLSVGLPDQLRGEIWCMLCRVQRERASHARDIYKKLLEIDNPEDEHRI